MVAMISQPDIPVINWRCGTMIDQWTLKERWTRWRSFADLSLYLLFWLVVSVLNPRITLQMIVSAPIVFGKINVSLAEIFHGW